MIVTLVLCLSAVLAAEQASPGPTSPEGEKWGCGIEALYHLLRCEGATVTMERLSSMMPSPEGQGHSFRDLREVAGLLGHPLRALMIDKSELRVDRPVILFFRMGDEGHFAVVRPVGHTGQLVQVLDGVREPTVLNHDALIRLPSWTGFALVPERRDVVSWLLFGMGAVAMGACLILKAGVRRLHGPKSTAQTSGG